MDKVLYSVGYGLIKGTHEERKHKFQKRLEYIQRGIGKPVTLVDIRWAESGSRNGKWFKQGHGRGMDGLVLELRYDKVDVLYIAEPDLDNTWGGAKWQLEMYMKFLVSGLEYGRYGLEMAEACNRVKAVAEEGVRAVLLMCGCKKAFKKNGTTWNCHRVPLAEALVKELGEGWKAVHL